MSQDEIIIAEALGKEVRIHAASTKDMCETMRQKHHCMPTSAAALGRIMTVTAIMASDLKNDEEKITSVFNGHGPAGTVLAQAKGNGDVRGFIGDPNLYMVREDGHLAVGAAIGQNGTLTVTKDLGLKEPFSGVVNIQTGEVGEDYAYYFAVSEQTPSIVSVGVLVNPKGDIACAGGMIIQLLPNAHEETISACEKIAAELLPMTDLLSRGDSLEEIIHRYFPDAAVLEHRDVRYHCGCSKEHYGDALMTLPADELKEMIAEEKPVHIRCQYCGSEYVFSKAELEELLEEKCGVSVK